MKILQTKKLTKRFGELAAIKNLNFEVFNSRERVKIESLDVWKMDPIWKK